MIRNVLSIGQSMNYLLETVLSDAYDLITVENVFHGMHLLKENKNIDLIIVDIDFQTKEAIDLILHIHSSRLYKQPIFALFSTSNYKAHEGVLKRCVYEHFKKPFNPIDLVKAIDKINASELSPSLS
ncbi:MAG: hypothetical protein INR73_10780 [Williamsia sp.]|nr:hypothetical protein [Williamsia sp.]